MKLLLRNNKDRFHDIAKFLGAVFPNFFIVIVFLLLFTSTTIFAAPNLDLIVKVDFSGQQRPVNLITVGAFEPRDSKPAAPTGLSITIKQE